MNMYAEFISAKISASDCITRQIRFVKQDLRLGLQTQLTLTPQLQQSIRLLQLSALEFNQELEAILQQNPLLERNDGDEGDDATSVLVASAGEREARDEVNLELAWGGREGEGPAGDNPDDDAGGEFEVRVGQSLREYLLEQVSLSPLAERERQLVHLLIESLNEEGFLCAGMDELMLDIPAELEVTHEELEAALVILQGFDPIGIGARDLPECLGLQLAALPAGTPWLSEAKKLVRFYLPQLADREYGKLKRLLGLVSDVELAAIRDLLATLNPRPGAAYARLDTQFVIPDVLVYRTREGWRVTLNSEAVPRLRVNSLYAGILRQHGESPALSAQLQEARWMIRSVQQRYETILRVARALVVRQQAWLEIGDAGLKPLVLREVADELGLHESTISRVTTQKYMLTPRGLVEFKHFFSSSLATVGGEAASSLAIKVIIKHMIGEENNLHPLSDQALSDALGREGFRVARRTVAKYREQMHIEPASQRRKI